MQEISRTYLQKQNYFRYVDGKLVEEEEANEPENVTEKVSQEFTQKTDLLLEYIEKTYLADGFVDTEEGRRVLAKMNMGSGQAPDEKKVMEYGFDAIFMGDKDSDSKK